jgi:hypothetical protein
VAIVFCTSSRSARERRRPFSGRPDCRVFGEALRRESY